MTSHILDSMAASVRLPQVKASELAFSALVQEMTTLASSGWGLTAEQWVAPWVAEDYHRRRIIPVYLWEGILEKRPTSAGMVMVREPTKIVYEFRAKSVQTMVDARREVELFRARLQHFVSQEVGRAFLTVDFALAMIEIAHFSKPMTVVPDPLFPENRSLQLEINFHVALHSS